ncbi:MAG: NUDIX hydrolase [Vicinamibacteria bacterium]
MGSHGWTAIAEALATRPRGRVEERVSRRAAVALVLREGPSGVELLFIRRADDPRDPWSGHVAFPGGRFEPGDLDLTATAIRETREELDLDLEADAELLGPLDEVRAVAQARPVDLAISPFVFRLLRHGDLDPSTEVRSVHWLPLVDLLGDSHRSSLERELQGRVVQLPCLRIQDLVIWGLTYRMFSDFQDRLASAGVELQTSGGSA